MTIRTSLLGGAALGALLALAIAPTADAKTKHHRRVVVVVAGGDGVKSDVDQLKAEVQSLEAWKDQEMASRAQTQAQVQQLQGQLADANARAQQAQEQVQAQIQTIPGEVETQVAKNEKPTGGWWDNTSISGRMYYDFSNIEEKSNVGNTGLNLGSPASFSSLPVSVGSGNQGHSPDGFNMDLKRFYVSVDHKFDDVWSADITTDFLYDYASSATQLYIKKAYVQAKLSPAFIVRLGSADMPWVPFDEDVYGYRYVENTLIDRTKFGTSADWGAHALGTIPVGPATVGYDVAVVNGMGYKKPGFLGGANRSDGMDFEGRVNVNFDGFVGAIGGYDGKLGQDYADVTTYHTAERFDALLAYSDKWFKLGGEYMWANADVSASQITSSKPADNSDAYEIFGNVNILPKVSIFGRYDWVKPKETSAPLLVNNYYNFGVSYEPVKIIDLAVLYKHDAIDNGAFADSNFATTSANGKATYDEVGLWGQVRW
jgi:gas vesicle protein